MVHRHLSTLLALTENELRLLRRDFGPIVLMIAMPLVLIPFIGPGMKAALREAGYSTATGAEQAVPGLAVLFSGLAVISVAFVFYREHGWNTWPRLRTSAATNGHIMVGKTLPMFFLTVAQMLVLFVLGAVLFGLQIRGSVLALLAVSAAHAAFVTSIALVLVAFCRSIQQANALANVGAILLAGVGGAIAPISSLPEWMRHVAPLSPPYWTMDALSAVILEGAGLRSVFIPIVILLGASVVSLTFAAMRFRMDDHKLSWS